MNDTHPSCGGGEAVKNGRSEEPARESEPYTGCEEILHDTHWWAGGAGTCEEVEEECGGYPSPELLGKVHVEWVPLVREVVCRVEVVGEGGDERVGGCAWD